MAGVGVKKVKSRDRVRYGENYHALDAAKIEANIVRNARGCWIWQKSLTNRGYPYLGQYSNLVHRASYRIYKGEIGTDNNGRTLHLDHRCRNKACVNPDHLYPVPARMNIYLAYIETHKQMPWKHLRMARLLHNLVGSEGDLLEELVS